MPPAEDSQPNERRPNRKGVANVPLVRSTAVPRRPTRGSFRIPRGHGAPLHSHRPAQTPSRQFAIPNPQQISSRTPTQYISNHSHSFPNAQNRSHNNSFPNTFVAPSNASKRTSVFPDNRQPKRPRIDSPNPQPPTSHPVASSPTVPANVSSKKSGICGVRTEHILEMPSNCYAGAPGCKKSRHEWRNGEIQRIEQDGRTEVYHVESLERHTRLFCRPRTSPQPSSQSTPALVLPMSVNNHPAKQGQQILDAAIPEVGEAAIKNTSKIPVHQDGRVTTNNKEMTSVRCSVRSYIDQYFNPLID